MNTRIYLTDNADLLRGSMPEALPPQPGCSDDLRCASLRLRVLGGARLGRMARAWVLEAAEKGIVPHVPARRRRSFSKSLGVLLGEGDKAAAEKKLLECPCIGSLSEGLLRITDDILGQLGIRSSVYCVEGEGAENQAVLRLILDIHGYKNLMVFALMREATFMSTSIQNWSHLQAVIQRV